MTVEQAERFVETAKKNGVKATVYEDYRPSFGEKTNAVVVENIYEGRRIEGTMTPALPKLRSDYLGKRYILY